MCTSATLLRLSFPLLLLFLLLVYIRNVLAEPDATPPPDSAALQSPLRRTPLLVVSTVDGAVSFFDARTGAALFTHQDKQPAITSWTAPGMPVYIPSLEGRIYRINATSNEIDEVDSKFIHRAAKAGLLPASRAQEESDALILKSEQTSAMYVDLRTGRVIHQLTFENSDPPILPALADNIIIISRTSVGVSIRESATGRELANATLVHTEPSFLDHDRCPNIPANTDAFVASVSDARSRITVRDIKTGDVLWTKSISADVIEAHGLAGVRMAADDTDVNALGPKEKPAGALPTGQVQSPEAPPQSNDVFVRKYGSQDYAMLASPNEIRDHEGRHNKGSRRYSSVRKYTISNLNNNEASQRSYRILGLDRLPVPNNQSPPYKREEDMMVVLTSRDAGLALLVLVVVGYVGYMAGSRPRRSSHRTKSGSAHRVPKRRRTSLPPEDAVDNNSPKPEGFESSDSNSDIDQLPIADAMLMKDSSELDGNSADMSLKPSEASPESLLLASNGSTSSGAGYVSNRSQTGWMTVGSLQVSSKVLGVGSHGTVVYEGKMQPGERKVAVKRLLRQFFESARKEISLLVELDEASPHVVRYFAMEEDSEFIYLALELCAASLAERVTQSEPPVPPLTYLRGPPPDYTSRALRQLLQGLADLHRVGVVHRDVKPQNVLITRAGNSVGDMKLADVGLALRLAANRSSYTAVTNAGGGVGTTGWRAPEVLNGGRQTKAVDIFAAGCIVSFVLTGGKHPFGNAIFGRDGRIVEGRPCLESLEALDLPEATDIVRRMLDPIAANRPTAEEALNHPFFWTDATKLSFLVDISDRLYDLRHHVVRYTENLDRYAYALEHCSDWRVRMDMDLLLDLGRQYEKTASGLLRIIRNKRNHYSELSSALRRKLGPLPEDSVSTSKLMDRSLNGISNTDLSEQGTNFLTYFTSRVPHLLLCVYRYAMANPALIAQPHFSRYGFKVPLDANIKLELHPLVRRAHHLQELSSSSQMAQVDTNPLGNSRNHNASTKNEEGDSRNSSNGSDEVIVTVKSTRRAYHRHELVALQQQRKEMPHEVKQKAMAVEIYDHNACELYRMRLAGVDMKDADLPSDEETETSTKPEVPVPTVASGFPRVLPKRTIQHNPPPYGARGPLRPPPGFGRGGAAYGSPNPGQQNQHQGRRGTVTGRNATVSQFTGEERVVDFGSLRRVKQ
ncbi:Serine/threonine-protein kinase/endoribonuclease IRE1 [Gracilariopsis chorda]|uniref:non-specific serine/threonine protein kinase n=1 Tax=Gracilariopsis chorda TaxID=448386 RepID=A0A2V3IUV3_9FLOR|nr:Serine/threonine-protein kinase/endoribonuclease IRE1 [Gracilariopsis chorda]|eukprot:PXF45477.1 Serine/threonine-protein kinase/endoribonuclease IRE1 [Gracilariopsis chorda]